MPYALGEMVLALVAYLIQQWQTLQIVLAVAQLSLCGIFVFMPESPRWLIGVNKPNQAFAILNKGATMNKKVLTKQQFENIFNSNPDEPNLENLFDSEPSKSQATKKKSKIGIQTLFREWHIARNTLIISINFMVCSMCYYGLAMNQVNLGSNMYVSFTLGGVFEVLGYVFAWIMIDHIGRKTVLVACQTVAGLSCIIGGVLQDDGEETNVVLVLSLTGNYKY